MKTLDEVIKAFEWCCNDDNDECDECPYNGEKDGCHQRNLDALNYLRAYRDTRFLADKQRKYLKDRIADIENPPLTWDELRKMEGKPVWIEGSHGCIWDQKSWALINFTHDGDMYCLVIEPKAGCFCIGEEDYGTDWQAYRKERE